MKEHYLAVIKFPVFVALALIAISAVFFGFALVGYQRLGFSPVEKVVYLSIFLLIIALVGTWILILTSTHIKLKCKSLSIYMKWMLFHIYFYFAKWLNAIFFKGKAGLMESFLHFNNEIVLTAHQDDKHEKILILLPHCLQGSNCKIRITADIINCEECGSCDIAVIKGMADKYQVHAAVATGGSLARKLITDEKPDVIIAVACHRDLVDGVRDAWQFPVYAVLNEHPKGPCFETTVSISTIEFAIKKFI
ncbi:MAG: DUF116 domain-containing protein [Candidatus Cloacimonadaceae bacterium]|nr:DUF116 domain-containing protein [Candidatus Cloacimonadaceae bacterium]